MLSEIYNDKFNAVRVARYDGSHLSTPGLASVIQLRSNQRDAAWRIIQNQATLIGHEVGMGKTLTAIVAAMESKRLGFTRKALIVVPNHTLVNWQAVMQIAYPGADMLIPNTDDLSKGKRAEFLSRVSTNDWDLILVPFSSFKLLPVSSQAKRGFYAEQIAELEEYLWEEKAKNKGKTRAHKDNEKALKRVAKTTMSTKLVSGHSDHLSEVAVGAVLQVAEEANGGYKVDLDMVKVEKKPGGSMTDTALIKGLVIDKEVVHSDMPKLVKKAKIGLDRKITD